MGQAKKGAWSISIMGYVWPREGGSGEIRLADRLTATTTTNLIERIQEAMGVAITGSVPRDVTQQEWKNLPVKMVFEVVVEKREVATYGQ